jgi:hypothetical protein
MNIIINYPQHDSEQRSARILAEAEAGYYGPGGRNLQCWYTAMIAQTEDGLLWLNHPTRPRYPEEVSLGTDNWSPADAFPRCIRHDTYASLMTLAEERGARR